MVYFSILIISVCHRALQKRPAVGSYTKRMEKYIKPDFLILDDCWALTFNNQFLNIINEIISERYEQGSLIISSNWSIENWVELFHEPVISSALLDRIFHNAHMVKMEGKLMT